MKFILGKKLAMTQVFKDDGTVVPVTRVQVGPCQITQIKKGKVNAVQVGFGSCREKVLSKSEKGHLKGLDKVKNLQDFKVDVKQFETINKGDYISIDSFVVGDKVAVTGVSKGKGFQGVVKRWNFKGGPASHGHKDQLRMPGSIGATGPQKVFKGTKMGGRMGGDQVTVENLEIIEVNVKDNELYLKGAVPGARNGFLSIKAKGELKTTNEQVNTQTNKPVNTETSEETDDKIEEKEEVVVEEVKTTEVKEEIKEVEKTKVEDKAEDKPEIKEKEELVKEENNNK